MPPAWRARSKAPQGYSRHASFPCSTARRKCRAMPYSSSTTWAKWIRSASPAPTARSTLRPPMGTVTNPRCCRPCRISSRIRAMGAAWVWPPRATRSPSLTRAAAAASSVQTGGILVSRDGMLVQMNQEVQENPGGGAPDHFLIIAPVADPDALPLVAIIAAAPVFRRVKARQRQQQQPFHFQGIGVKIVRVRDQAHKGGDAVAGDGSHRRQGAQDLHRLRLETDLFLGLPEGGGQQIGVPGVLHPAGKGD